MPLPQSGAAPQIATPCFVDPPLLAPGVTGVSRAGWIDGAPSPNIEYASGFKLFIYIVPEAVVERYLSYATMRGSRAFAQERRMQGDTGVVFSTAYYLSPSEFRSSRYLEYVLQSGLSIGRMQGESVTNPFVPPDAPTPPAIYWTSGHAATATPTPPIP